MERDRGKGKADNKAKMVGGQREAAIKGIKVKEIFAKNTLETYKV